MCVGDTLPWSGTPSESHRICGLKEEGGKGQESFLQKKGKGTAPRYERQKPLSAYEPGHSLE